MEGQLRVTPQELMNTSTEFSAKGQKVNALTQEMLSLIASLSGGWEGDASGAYTRKFADLSGDIQQIYNKIKEHADDLMQMGQKYQQVENAETEANTAMPSDLID